MLTKICFFSQNLKIISDKNILTLSVFSSEKLVLKISPIYPSPLTGNMFVKLLGLFLVLGSLSILIYTTDDRLEAFIDNVHQQQKQMQNISYGSSLYIEMLEKFGPLKAKRTGWYHYQYPLSGLPLELPPENIDIINYTVNVILDCNQHRFPVIITEIGFTSTINTSTIYLHKTLDIELDHIELVENGIVIDDQLTVYKRSNTELAITGKHKFQKRRYYVLRTLHVSLLQYYKDERDRSVVLATTRPGLLQTRSFIPCWDHPDTMVTFDLNLVYPREYTSVGITERIDTNATINLLKVLGKFHVTNEICIKHKLHNFKRTQLMQPRYFSFLVYRNFDCTSKILKDKTKFSVCARDVYDGASRELAFTYGQKFFEFLHNFTGQEGSIVKKLDQFAIPVALLPEGTMGSWGLKIYNELDLLYHPQNSSNSQKQRVVLAVARGLADLWFNNLLDTDYWAQNEGLPRLFSYLIPDKFEPSWELERQFSVDYIQESLQNYLWENPAYSMNLKELEEFVKSDKRSACFFQTTRYMMGPQVFESILHNYFRTKSSLHPEDLIKWLEIKFPKNISITREFFSAFVNSFKTFDASPIVVVSSIENSSVALDNEHRLLYKTFRVSKSVTDKWNISISYTKSVDDRKFLNTTPSFMLQLNKPKDKIIVVPKETEWIILNNQQKGYYRVLYEQPLLKKIASALNKPGFDGIHELNRAQIVDDYFFFAKNNVRSFKTFFLVCEFLKADSSYYPWKSAFRAFTSLFNSIPLREVAVRKKFLEMVQGLMKTVYGSVSFQEDKDFDHMYSLKREMVMSHGCLFGFEHCINNSRNALAEYQKTKKKPDKNLRATIYCYGLRHSTNITGSWEFLFREYTKTHSIDEQTNLLKALACPTDKNILNKYLSMFILENRKTYSDKLKDPHARFKEVCDSSLEALEVANDYIMTHKEDINMAHKESLLFYAIKLNDRFLTEEHRSNSSELRKKLDYKYRIEYIESVDKMNRTIDYVRELVGDLKQLFGLVKERPKV